MSRLLAVLATLAVGALVAIALGVLALVLGEAGQVKRIPHIPAGYLTGGRMGAALISVSLGTALVTAK